MKLKLQDLAFAYEKNNEVLRGVTLEVESGEVLCLLGPNGAGKTTLFKSILGLLKPSKGKVLIDGKDVRDYPRKELAHYLGYVPQNHIPPFPFRVLEVVLMGRTAHINNFAVPSTVDVEIAREAMRRLNIGHLENRNYAEISGGERQLVLIARALAQKPGILVLDEPTSNLDFGNQLRILRHIKRLAESGLTVVMSSHFPEHAFYCGSKVAVMQKGRIIHVGRPEEVITGQNLKEIYGVEVEVAEIERKGINYRVCIPSVV
ncbi:ABC transporter, ATP binding protein [Thermacetogenium phaeum DSM 12270]|uniref:ABC transporter, ATP binding protein n=1 Tax=Thermacetogenium phaeum (strain ATCC BAA-254 / DSM 26808 / PB) TaxID=1089553 RepID=K4LCB2_THEPS|nr:ABC transporter ATP-binding protein [Thermacetogenium phaeum]AFV10368.1 ABC transporter, ATP binding protein [Thermacetogenium phaeum DSM 12270]